MASVWLLTKCALVTGFRVCGLESAVRLLCVRLQARVSALLAPLAIAKGYEEATLIRCRITAAIRRIRLTSKLCPQSPGARFAREACFSRQGWPPQAYPALCVIRATPAIFR